MSDMVYLAPPEVAQYGLTKREAFAMAAMQGLCADPSGRGSYGDYAKDAVRYADALLAELASPSPAADVNADLVEVLRVLAGIPIEDFGKQDKPDQPLMGWNAHTIYVRDVLAARAALRKAGAL